MGLKAAKKYVICWHCSWWITAVAGGEFSGVVCTHSSFHSQQTFGALSTTKSSFWIVFQWNAGSRCSHILKQKTKRWKREDFGKRTVYTLIGMTSNARPSLIFFAASVFSHLTCEQEIYKTCDSGVIMSVSDLRYGNFLFNDEAQIKT